MGIFDSISILAISISSIISPLPSATLSAHSQVNYFDKSVIIAKAKPTPTPTPIVIPKPKRLEISEPTLQPAIAPSPLPTPAPIGSPAVLSEAQINFLGNCESGMTASRNSGNGYFGAFQFSIGTWNSMGTAYARADLAPLEVQKDAVQRLVARSSVFSQFPGCSAQMHTQSLL